MPSSPPTSWADLAGARVGVWGLGVEGRASVRRLRALGVAPVVVDDALGDAVVEGSTVLGSGPGLDALSRCEVVVKSPGISRYGSEVRDLEDAGVTVAGGLGLWMEEVDRDTVVVVTGTKGKSTTVSIAGHLLRGLGVRAALGGNIGVPPWDSEGPADVERWVVEASSFQITDLWSAPPVVGVTSLGDDHIDWHGGSRERYVADKLALCRLPGARLTVAAGDDPGLRAETARLGPEVAWVQGPVGPWADGLGLLGDHNRSNAAVARALLVAWGVEGADDDGAVAAAAAGFAPLVHRLQIVAEAGGVTFVDDGLSTSVLPTVAALRSFADRPVALLAGGYDRGVDYRPLAATLRARLVPTLLVALPDNGPRIAATVTEDGALPPHLEILAVDDLADGVAAGAAWAPPGGVVLLAPAAPSFGRFIDYRDRSAAFLAAVRSWIGD